MPTAQVMSVRLWTKPKQPAIATKVLLNQSIQTRRFEMRQPVAVLAFCLSACASAPSAVVATPAPVAELTQTCAGKSGWRDPGPPVRVDGNVYYVGTCGITALLITSPAGHVLIDSAEAEAVPQILANVRQLGLDPADIKWLLASHVHFDHVGGHAAMQAATGARIAALPDQARELEQGEAAADDPQHGVIKGTTSVKVDRLLADGVPLVIGANRITPYATPGHTRGSTSWVIRQCRDDAACPAIVLADSISPISADAYRFGDHNDWVSQFRSGVGRIANLPCSILVTPHPAGSKLFERLSGTAPLADSNACKEYSAYGIDWLERRLTTERPGP